MIASSPTGEYVHNKVVTTYQDWTLFLNDGHHELRTRLKTLNIYPYKANQLSSRIKNAFYFEQICVELTPKPQFQNSPEKKTVYGIRINYKS